MPDFSLPRLTPQEALASADRLIDVRRREARAESGIALRGASWVDPLALSLDHPVLTGSGRLIFFCAKGHEVGQYATALALVAGREAAFVAGGFAALVSAGAPTVPVADDAA